MDGEGVNHRTVKDNGISMHVAEKGEGPPVQLLHGFPELWDSWGHQIAALAAHGYHAIAADLRGYGDSSAPPSTSSYTVFHIVGDIVPLLDALAIPQVFMVGYDWGALIAWCMCLPFMPRNAELKLVKYFRSLHGEDYYIFRNWELGAPCYGVQIKVPVKFIVGDTDLTYHYPGVQDYLHKGSFKQDVPILEDVVVMEGVAHFVNQEKGTRGY